MQPGMFSASQGYDDPMLTTLIPTSIFRLSAIACVMAPMIGSPANAQQTANKIVAQAAPVSVTTIAPGVYSIFSVQTGLALDGGGNAQRARLWLYPSNGTNDQIWVIKPIGPNYTISNVESGVVLDGADNTPGSEPWLWTLNTTSDQLWTFQPADGGFLIKSAQSGLVIDALHNLPKGPICLNNIHNMPEQVWKFVPVPAAGK